jgi:hypothetical protein
MTRCTTNHGCENMVEFDIPVAGASQPNTRINLQVTQESNIQRLPATLHNTRAMDHYQVHYGSSKAVPILHPVGVEMA